LDIKRPDVIKKIENDILKLKGKFNHTPTAKELVRENKGKFLLYVPKAYIHRVYKRLWGMKILPRIINMEGTNRIMVNNKTNLQKAYKAYLDILREEGEKVPSMEKIIKKL
jgi:hypothetical protein